MLAVWLFSVTAGLTPSKRRTSLPLQNTRGKKSPYWGGGCRTLEGDKVGEPWRLLQLSYLARRLDNGQGGAWAWRLWGLGRDAAPTGTTEGWSCLVVLVGLTLKTHLRLTAVLISNRILSAFNVSSMWIVSVKSSVIWSVWTLWEPGQCHPGFGGNISFCWDHNKPSPLTALKGDWLAQCLQTQPPLWVAANNFFKKFPLNCCGQIFFSRVTTVNFIWH